MSYLPVAYVCPQCERTWQIDWQLTSSAGTLEIGGLRFCDVCLGRFLARMVPPIVEREVRRVPAKEASG